MNGLLRGRKNLIRWVLGAVLAVDLVLVGINWQIARTPRPVSAELKLLKRQRDLLAADVARGEQIRKELPAVEQQCESFYKEELRPTGTGYSSLVDNLGAVSRDAGLRPENITYRQHDADKRGIVEVEIHEAVAGNYPSVVRFINGLQHSNNFYVLDAMTLATGSTGELKLDLRLRTYFRTS